MFYVYNHVLWSLYKSEFLCISESDSDLMAKPKLILASLCAVIFSSFPETHLLWST